MASKHHEPEEIVAKLRQQLEQENSRLRRTVSDLTLEKLVLKEAAAGSY